MSDFIFYILRTKNVWTEVDIISETFTLPKQYILLFKNILKALYSCHRTHMASKAEKVCWQYAALRVVGRSENLIGVGQEEMPPSWDRVNWFVKKFLGEGGTPSSDSSVLLLCGVAIHGSKVPLKQQSQIQWMRKNNELDIIHFCSTWIIDSGENKCNIWIQN